MPKALRGPVPAEPWGAAQEEDRLLVGLIEGVNRDRRECERLRQRLAHMQLRLRQARSERAQARKAARLDGLTGLPNRRAPDLLAQRAPAAAPGPGALVAVLYVDLDGFKPVNDRLGHQAGDRVLQIISDRLSQALRQSDIVARVDGDDFVCVLPDLAEAGQAQAIALDLIALIAAPCPVGAERVVVGASIGIAIHRRRDADVRRLCQRGDRAMYAAKARGRGLAMG